MKLTKPFTVLLSLIFIFTACEDPTKDVSLHFSPRMYKYVMEVELYDFTDLSALYEGNVQVKISGPDADKIYNIDGSKSYSANFGRILLITDAAGEPTAANPLKFNVSISSNSYETKNVFFTVPAGQTYVSQDAYLVSSLSPPEGLTRSSTSASLSASGELNQNLQFQASPAGTANAMSINIPTGVKFKDASGIELNGSNLNVSVTGYDATKSDVNLALPNAGLHLYEENGEVITYLIPVDGIFKIDMDVDGEAVKTFTGAGAELKMPMPTNIINKEANRPFQAGDQVQLLSFSDGNTAYQNEGTFTVVEEGGVLYIKPKVNHLSYYTIATRPSASGNTAYTMKLINGLEEKESISVIENSIFSFTVDMNAKTFNSLSFGNYFNRVFNIDNAQIEDYLGKDIVIRHDHPQLLIGARACASCYVEEGTERVKIEITQQGSNRFELLFRSPIDYVTVGYSLSCEGQQATYQPPFGSAVYFRESGSGSTTWKLLYTFDFSKADNKLHRLRGLRDGGTYDFKLTWFELELFETSLTLEEGKIFKLELTAEQCSDIGF